MGRGRLGEMTRAKPGGVEPAFTLIELLVVILIVGTLLALVIPNFVLFVERARRSAVRNNMHVVQLALEAFAVDHSGSLPMEAGTDNFVAPLEPYFPGGDPFGFGGEPGVGVMPVNPYDGKRYNDESKDIDFEYDELVGELESGQNAQLHGNDEDCPYLEFGNIPDYPGGIGVATHVSEAGLELPDEYGIYGFGRDPTFPMYSYTPGCTDPTNSDHWVFFALHN
jgi:prepilin-type N-terminal cleavage/methylation domain-containing protein